MLRSAFGRRAASFVAVIALVGAMAVVESDATHAADVSTSAAGTVKTVPSAVGHGDPSDKPTECTHTDPSSNVTATDGTWYCKYTVPAYDSKQGGYVYRAFPVDKVKGAVSSVRVTLYGAGSSGNGVSSSGASLTVDVNLADVSSLQMWPGQAGGVRTSTTPIGDQGLGAYGQDGGATGCNGGSGSWLYITDKDGKQLRMAEAGGAGGCGGAGSSNGGHATGGAGTKVDDSGNGDGNDGSSSDCTGGGLGHAGRIDGGGAGGSGGSGQHVSTDCNTGHGGGSGSQRSAGSDASRTGGGGGDPSTTSYQVGAGGGGGGGWYGGGGGGGGSNYAASGPASDGGSGGGGSSGYVTATGGGYSALTYIDSKTGVNSGDGYAVVSFTPATPSVNVSVTPNTALKHGQKATMKATLSPYVGTDGKDITFSWSSSTDAADHSLCTGTLADGVASCDSTSLPVNDDSNGVGVSDAAIQASFDQTFALASTTGATRSFAVEPDDLTISADIEANAADPTQATADVTVSVPSTQTSYATYSGSVKVLVSKDRSQVSCSTTVTSSKPNDKPNCTLTGLSPGVGYAVALAYTDDHTPAQAAGTTASTSSAKFVAGSYSPGITLTIPSGGTANTALSSAKVTVTPNGADLVDRSNPKNTTAYAYVWGYGKNDTLPTTPPSLGDADSVQKHLVCRITLPSAAPYTAACPSDQLSKYLPSSGTSSFFGVYYGHTGVNSKLSDVQTYLTDKRDTTVKVTINGKTTTPVSGTVYQTYKLGVQVTYTDGKSGTPPNASTPIKVNGTVVCTLAKITDTCPALYVPTTKGTYTITAEYPGNDDAIGRTGTSTLNVAALTGSVDLAADPTTAVAGQAVQLQAALDVVGYPIDATGTYTFFDGADEITSCTSAEPTADVEATCDVPVANRLPGSTHDYTVEYTPSDLGVLKQPDAGAVSDYAIPRADTTTAVSLADDTVQFGDSTLATATVSTDVDGATPDGTVTFSIDDVPVPSCTGLALDTTTFQATCPVTGHAGDRKVTAHMTASTVAGATTATSDESDGVTLTVTRATTSISGMDANVDDTTHVIDVQAEVRYGSNTKHDTRLAADATIVASLDGDTKNTCTLTATTKTCPLAIPSATGDHTVDFTFAQTADLAATSNSTTVSVANENEGCPAQLTTLQGLLGKGPVTVTIPGGTLTATLEDPGTCNGASHIDFKDGKGTLAKKLALTDVSGRFDVGGLELSGVTANAPTAWKLPSLSLPSSVKLKFPYKTTTDGSVELSAPKSGRLEVDDAALPFVSVPGAPTVDITLDADGTGLSLSTSLHSPDSTVGVTITAELTTGGKLTDGSLSTTGLTLFGQALSLSATFEAGENESGPHIVATASLPGPIAIVPGVRLKDVTATIEVNSPTAENGLRVDATALLGSTTTATEVPVGGTIVPAAEAPETSNGQSDGMKWSLNFGTADKPYTPAPWTPVAGMTISPSFSGSVARDDQGKITYTLGATFAKSDASWPIVAGAAANLTSVTLGNQTACVSHDGKTTVADVGAPVLTFSGAVTVGPIKNAAIDGCVALVAGKVGFALHGSADKLAINSAVTLDDPELGIVLKPGTKLPSLDGSASADFDQAAGPVAVHFSLDDGTLVATATGIDLTPFGLPAKGWIAYAAKDVTDVVLDKSNPDTTVDLKAGVTASGSIDLGSAGDTLRGANFAIGNAGLDFTAHIGGGSISFEATIGAPDTVPFLALPGGASLQTATLRYEDGVLDLHVEGSVVTDASGASAPVVLDLHVSKGSFTGTASVHGLSVFGASISLDGTITAGGGKTTGSLIGTLDKPFTPSGSVLTIESATVTLAPDGLSAKGSLSAGSVTGLKFDAAIGNMGRYSLTLSGSIDSWSPAPGVTFSPTFSGTIDYSRVGITIDVEATGTGGNPLFSVTDSGVEFSVSDVELSNTRDASSCPGAKSGDLWLAADGSLGVNVTGLAGSLDTSGCFDITSKSFHVDAKLSQVTIDLGAVHVGVVTLALDRDKDGITGSVSLPIVVDMPSGNNLSITTTLAITPSGFVISARADLSRFFDVGAASTAILLVSSTDQTFDTKDPVLKKLVLSKGVSIGLGITLPSAMHLLTSQGVDVPDSSTTLAAVATIDPTTASTTFRISYQMGSGGNLFTSDGKGGVSLDSASLYVALNPTAVAFGMQVDATLHLPATLLGPATTAKAHGRVEVNGETLEGSLELDDWNDAMGIGGLNIKQLALQVGVDAEGIPSAAFSATVTHLPDAVAKVIGYNNNGTTPISVAINLSVEQFLVDFKIGTDGSTTPALSPLAVFGRSDLLNVNYAELYLSPTGARIAGTYYKPGLILALQSSIAGIPLNFKINVDPVNVELHADAELGAITFGNVTLGPVEFHLDAGKSGVDIGFDASVKLGPGSVDIGPDMKLSGYLLAKVHIKVGTSGLEAAASIHAHAQGKLYTPALCENPSITLFGCDGDWSWEVPVNFDTDISFSLTSSGLSVSVSGIGNLTLPFPQKSTAAAARSLTTGSAAGTPTATIGKQPSGQRVVRGAATAWTGTGGMAQARELASTVTLSDGRVLALGGSDGQKPLRSGEVYSPKTGEWTAVAQMHEARVRPVVTLLSGGRILVAGGVGTNGPLTSSEIYDPTTNAWSVVGALHDPRAYATGTTLDDGRVLVTGGIRSKSGSGRFLDTAEVFDPKIGTWTSAGTVPGGGRALAVAAKLADGSVLVAGGHNASEALSSAVRYVPSTGEWTKAAAMRVPQFLASAVTLQDGRVLVVGGTAQAQLFDPASGTWKLAGALASAPQWTSAVLLRDGRVLVVGGYSHGAARAAAYLWQPATRTFAKVRSLPTQRFAATVATLPSGAVLIAGGGSTLNRAEYSSYLWSSTSADAIGTKRHPVSTPHAVAAPASSDRSWIVYAAVGVGIVGVVTLLLLTLAARRRRSGVAAPIDQ